ESIDCAFARFNTIITNLKALDEGYSSKIYVRKFLRALHPKWRAKAKKESSDEECLNSGSEDEEYAMARSRDDKNGKGDRKCFRFGDPNHLIGECPKPLKYKNQRAFVGGSWSNNGEEDDEKVKDETCLVAQASNEMDNMNAVFDAKVTIHGTLHTLTSIKELLGQVHEIKQEQNNDVVLLLEPLKKVRVSEVLEVIRSPNMWSALSDEDSVKVCLLLIYILEMYRNNKFWWKKDPLVIPRGLAWSKIGKFEKEDYGALFFEWSIHIMSMAPTSTELLQPWLIRSMDYLRTLLVDRQPNDPITASPNDVQEIICAADVHDPQFEQQSKQVVESVPVFTSVELVAKYHSITISVQLIENVRDGNPSIVLKELATVKQMMNDIERFVKSRNDNLLEDSVAKPESAISDVFIGEISCENLVEKQLQSRDMCIQSIGNQFVQHPLESPNRKECAGFDFDNTDNYSLFDMVKTEEEEIHLDGLEKVDDPFVQTPVKQNYEVKERSRKGQNRIKTGQKREAWRSREISKAVTVDRA
nr:phospholipase-like protein [Tanacetum cinerariifolium]